MTHPRFAGLDLEILRARAERLASDPTAGLLQSSVDGLDGQWRRICRWYEAHGVALPLSEDDVLRLLVAHEGRSYSHLRSMRYAISRHHPVLYGTNPTKATCVEEFLRGYARLYGTRQNPVDALRPDEYRVIVATAPTVLGPFVAARLRGMLSVSYAGWLRGSETCGLGADALLGNGTGFGVLVGPSKGHSSEFVLLELPAGTGTMVESELRRYFAAARSTGITFTKGGPLFPALGKETSISFDRYQEDLRAVAQAAGITRRIATHSPRRGGASACARDLPGDEALKEIMRRGRWRSVDVAMAYVEEWDGFAPELQLDYPSSSPSTLDQSSSNQRASSM